jgi:threonylcarbamoyladenosine tRNA methylthiotransferase MtaB
MPTVALATLGCKVNLYETDRIMAGLEGLGYTVVEPDGPADVYVVNTCSVTQVAESKSRRVVRRLRRERPASHVVVTGCGVEMARLTGQDFGAGVVVVPNAAKLSTPSIIARVLSGGATGATSAQSVPARRRTRAVVKVQDGCDMACSYCSVPLTRGTVRSRAVDEILTEVATLAALGTPEVVLAGILVGAYGRDFEGRRPNLADLVREVCASAPSMRVRLSSIEPTHVTDELLAVMGASATICRHLHVPLQSGADSVLAGMNRPYTGAGFLDVCARARLAMPDVGITTDVMVGFPGETAEAHARSVALARDAGFARMHVFRFSPRPGTEAARLLDDVGDGPRAARAAEMSALAADLQSRFARRHLGHTLDVVAEQDGAAPGKMVGYTGNYIRVRFDAPTTLSDRVVRVCLTSVDGTDVRGEFVGDASAISGP